MSDAATVSETVNEVVSDLLNDDTEASDDTTQPYLVRLLFEVDAENPRQAVQRFIEMILRYGLRPWTFRVDENHDEDPDDLWENWLIDGNLRIVAENGQEVDTPTADTLERQNPLAFIDPAEEADT